MYYTEKMSLRNARLIGGIKIKDAAQYAGISPKTLTIYETKAQNTPLRVAVALCDYYKVPMDLIKFS